MTPLNRRAAHASSSHLLRPYPSCSSYSHLLARLRRHFASSSPASLCPAL
ncbi:hypothetical protein ACP70R_038371 [Stipagrostis hirtigluma subsp. patula]